MSIKFYESDLNYFTVEAMLNLFKLGFYMNYNSGTKVAIIEKEKANSAKLDG